MFAFTRNNTTNGVGIADVLAAKYIFAMPPEEKKKPRYLRQEPVANCCGINWLAGLPHPVYDEKRAFTENVEENKHLLDDVRKDVKSQLKEANSVMLIAVNHIQNRIYKDMLIEEGFNPILENAYHQEHGHTLFIYAWRKYERTTPTSNS